MLQAQHLFWMIDNGGQVSSTSSTTFSLRYGLMTESVVPSTHFVSFNSLSIQEEIRLTVGTWSQTLLPAHHEAITLCWNEALNKAPIAERSRLVHFLLQLRPHFPFWRGK